MAGEARAVRQPRLGPRGWLRWAWRLLTSMRTALFLLLLLAVGAVPGSIFPQRGIDAGRTADWIAAHPTAGPILDRLGFFTVYSSPWFAAIYLMLFVSLVGCVLPRTRIHADATRSAPPRAPRRPERLGAGGTWTTSADPETVLATAQRELRRRRMRVHRHDATSVSAESGYLKETGNLLFHLALIGIIVGVAYGHLFGWKGDAIVPVGQTFTKARFDTFRPGPLVDIDDIGEFTVAVDQFDAEFESEATGPGQFGMPRTFTAHVTVADAPGAPTRGDVIEVNHPLELDGATVFLLGNGYAPHVTVRDAAGQVLYTGSTAFLPQDNNYRSVGAVKVPAADPQLGFVGLFLPTAIITDEGGPQSIFPDALDPALALTVFTGDLFPDAAPQSVFTLDTQEMDQVTTDGENPLRLWLTPGQTVDLPDGLGSITFDRVDRFAGLSVRNDPGKWLTLGSALAALTGLVASLVVPRRRVFVRVDPASRLVRVGGLAKTDDAGLADMMEQLMTTLKDARDD